VAKSVVVTGANSGIGLATTLHLAGHGYDVIGTVRSVEKAAAVTAAAAAASTATSRDLSVRVVLCDVTSAAETRRAFAEIAELTSGGPWAVVNNAGISQPGAVEDVSDEDARHQLEVNVLGPARIARLVLPSMRERGDGRIVMMSSIAGRVAFPMLGWYAASKHALEALSDSLRAEVAPFGVRVVLIEPGGFNSAIWSSAGSRLPEPNEAYRAAYERAFAVAANRGPQLPHPIWVARAVHVALRSRVPLARYLVGADAMVGTALHTLAPTMVTDYAKSLAAGLRRRPWA
jgi:NAD(P)-dependent dehydrogenase (short-subunit alcohol dehydrogenase family)